MFHPANSRLASGRTVRNSKAEVQLHDVVLTTGRKGKGDNRK